MLNNDKHATCVLTTVAKIMYDFMSEYKNKTTITYCVHLKLLPFRV